MKPKLLPIFRKFWIMNPLKTCCLIFFLQAFLLLLILIIGFIYVHSYIPYYNEKRLSTSQYVCSTVEDRIVPTSICEVLQDEDFVYGSSSTPIRPKFYENGHSVDIPGPNGTVVGVRHFKWSSCGEFCSVEGINGAGGCRQIKVNVRAPGSDLRVERCTNYEVFECGHRLYTGTEFGPEQDENSGRSGVSFSSSIPEIDGIFECKPTRQQQSGPSPPTPICTIASNKWSCPDLSSYSSAELPRFPLSENCSSASGLSNCFSQAGLYICTNGSCSFISHPLGSPCSRKCESIPLLDKNLIITNHHGRVITTNCWKAFHSQLGFELWPRKIRNQVNPSQVPALFLNCNIIKTTQSHSSHSSKSPLLQSGDNIRLDLGDCVNGTLLENSTLPPSMSFISLENLWFETMRTEDFLLDPVHQKHAPPERSLSLFNNAPLYIEDFYESTRTTNSCDKVGAGEDEMCSTFYSNYGLGIDSTQEEGSDKEGSSDRFQGHLPLFPCYCRNTQRSTYCIVNASKLFTQDWEQYLVSTFIIPYTVPFISLVSSVAAVILIFLCILMYPVFQDLVVAKNIRRMRSSTANTASNDFGEDPVMSNMSIQRNRRASYSYSIKSSRGSLNDGRNRRPSIFLITSDTPVNIVEVESLGSNSPHHLGKPEVLFEKRDWRQ